MAQLHFFGNSLNAVKTQIWIAICTCLIAICTCLIAILPHRSIYQRITLRNFLRLVEVNMFEKVTLEQMVLNALESNVIRSQDDQQNSF